MTFSIVAIDRKTGAIGSAVASRSVAVGGTVAYSRIGVGVVNTQHYAHLTLGEHVLDEMERGRSPHEALDHVLQQEDPVPDTRQLIAIDVQGRRGAWTGRACHLEYHHVIAGDCVAAGNYLVGPAVIERMVEAFRENPDLRLGPRLLRCLEAGQQAGGDRRGRQAAAVKVVPRRDSSVAINLDLRVDDHPDPLRELARLYEVFREEFEE